MGPIRLLVAPIRRIGNSRLFQLGIVVTIIVLLENFSDNRPVLGQAADGLDKLVEGTVQLFSEHLVRLRTFTKSLLTDSVMIGYVYVVCLIVFAILRHVIRYLIDLVGLSNFLWLRSSIARERGIAAYQAWLPLERIRPADYPQPAWEEHFAWHRDNSPPYPPLTQRIAYHVISYVVVLGGAAVLLQFFTPFPVLTWLGKLTGMTV